MRHRDIDPGVRDYREILNDGLLDILFGLLVVTVVGYAALDRTVELAEVGLFLVVMFLVLGFEFARRHITYRRIGLPEDTGDFERRHAIVLFAVLLSLLVGAGLPFAFPHAARLAGGYFALILLAGIVTLVSGTIAIAFSAPRFWLYAVLFGTPMLARNALERAGLPSELGYYFGFSAAVAVLTGGVLLLRFVRKHPPPPRENAPRTIAHA